MLRSLMDGVISCPRRNSSSRNFIGWRKSWKLFRKNLMKFKAGNSNIILCTFLCIEGMQLADIIGATDAMLISGTDSISTQVTYSRIRLLLTSKNQQPPRTLFSTSRPIIYLSLTIGFTLTHRSLRKNIHRLTSEVVMMPKLHRK